MRVRGFALTLGVLLADACVDKGAHVPFLYLLMGFDPLTYKISESFNK